MRIKYEIRIHGILETSLLYIVSTTRPTLSVFGSDKSVSFYLWIPIPQE
jgi:hypothetical protein